MACHLVLPRCWCRLIPPSPVKMCGCKRALPLLGYTDSIIDSTINAKRDGAEVIPASESVEMQTNVSGGYMGD